MSEIFACVIAGDTLARVNLWQVAETGETSYQVEIAALADCWQSESGEELPERQYSAAKPAGDYASFAQAFAAIQSLIADAEMQGRFQEV